MKIRFTRKAIIKLSNINEYFKAFGQTEIGHQVRTKIIEKIKSLNSFPLLGPEEETIKDLGIEIRYLISGNYKILYKVEGDEVLILNVFDTRQDPEKIKE